MPHWQSWSWWGIIYVTVKLEEFIYVVFLVDSRWSADLIGLDFLDETELELFKYLALANSLTAASTDQSIACTK